MKWWSISVPYLKSVAETLDGSSFALTIPNREIHEIIYNDDGTTEKKYTFFESNQ